MATTKRSPLAHAAKSLDAESKAMLYEGLNMTQLSFILEMDRRDIEKKIEGKVGPCGTRNGAGVYKLKDILPWVVKPGYDIEGYLRKMHHSELPKMLTKEFWAGQRAKQEFEIRNGDLWPTKKVIEEVGELFKVVKMSVRLSLDSVERQTELSERQRGIIKQQMDGLLLDLHKRITEKFSEPESGLPQDEDDDEL